MDKITAMAGIGTNLESAAITKASGDINAQISEKGVRDTTLRQISANNNKEAMNWAKIGSGAGVSASAEAARALV